MTKPFDVAIIGAGAAGLFCAGLLGQAGLRVVVLDSGKKIGRKILMSGGGFCNFTNLDVGAEPTRTLSNPPFLVSPSGISSRWLIIIRLLITKKSVASCFATLARAKLCACCKASATKAM